MAESKNTAIDRILECAICLNQIEKPHIFVKCLHSFCKSCIDNLPKKTKVEQLGWFCPMCNQFSDELSLKANFFVEDLLGVVNKSSKESVKCDQCTNDVNAECKCLDCKPNLCSQCQAPHLKIPALKGHQVLPIDSELESFVDRLVYCRVHQDKTIELNCKQCELAMCILCHVVDHNGHETETIDGALERLLPKLKGSSEQVKHNLKDIQGQIGELDQQSKATEENFKQCENDINKEYDELIQKLIHCKEKQIHKVNEQKLKSLKTIAGLKTTLQNKLRNCENLINLVETCTVKARHATLLREIQSGLYANTLKQGADKQGVIEMKMITPVFEKENESPSVDKLTCLLGDVNFKEIVRKLETSGEFTATDVQKPEQVECFDKALNQPWKQWKQIKLGNDCYWISQVNDNIIICLYNKMEIKSVSITTCDVQTFKSKHKFNIIRQAHDKTLVGAADDGLYITSEKEIANDNNWIELDTGEHADICVYGHKFSVLRRDTCEVITYELTKEKGHWVQQRVIQVQDIVDPMTMVYHMGHYIIASFRDVVKYTEHNQLVKKVSCDTKPLLIDIDSSGKLLVASHSARKFSLYNIDTLEICKDVNAEYLADIRYPRDMMIQDGKVMWVLSGDINDADGYITIYNLC